jgi:hypothetical protein
LLWLSTVAIPREALVEVHVTATGPASFFVNGVPQMLTPYALPSLLAACGVTAAPANLAQGTEGCGRAIISPSTQLELFQPQRPVLARVICAVRGTNCSGVNSSGLVDQVDGRYLALWHQPALGELYVATSDSAGSSALSALDAWATRVRAVAAPVYTARPLSLGCVARSGAVTGDGTTTLHLWLHLDGRAIVTLLQTYDPGWRLRVTGSGVTVGRHLRVNGFANGWVVTGHGQALVSVTYEPNILYRDFGDLNVLLTAAAAAVCLLASVRLRRRSRDTAA